MISSSSRGPQIGHGRRTAVRELRHVQRRIISNDCSADLGRNLGRNLGRKGDIRTPPSPPCSTCLVPQATTEVRITPGRLVFAARSPQRWPCLFWARSGTVGGAHSASAATLSCDTPSLISAITTANGTPGGSTLVLPTGCVYTLESANNTTEGGTGLPVITGNVTIQGSGATITRSSATGVTAFRIFDVASGGSLTLNSLTLSNGLANNGQQGGGAIFNHGTLAVTRAAPSPTTRHPPPPAPRVGPSTAAGRSA